MLVVVCLVVAAADECEEYDSDDYTLSMGMMMYCCFQVGSVLYDNGVVALFVISYSIDSFLK